MAAHPRFMVAVATLIALICGVAGRLPYFMGSPDPVGAPGSGPAGAPGPPCTEEQRAACTGLPGLDGMKGSQGLPGMAGPRGPICPPGIHGSPCMVKGGPEQDDCVTGPEGPGGPAGMSGRDGYPGHDGEPGGSGLPGQPGVRGDSGVQVTFVDTDEDMPWSQDIGSFVYIRDTHILKVKLTEQIWHSILTQSADV